MKRKRKALLLGLVILTAIAVFAGYYVLQKHARERDASLAGPEDSALRYRPSVSYQGERYPLKRNISSLLLIGTDNFINDEKQYEGLPYNFNLADFLTVVVFDHRAKTIVPFQICRDTMCEVPVTSGGTRRMQITLAHTYGSGGADSCENTRKAAKGLLFDVPIDHYLAFTMDAVPYVNDLLGGITLTLEDDIPALGSAYREGASVTLKGSEALRFVRYRDSSQLDDNLRRMKHHRQYLLAVVDAARAASAEDPEFPLRMFHGIEEYVDTDLSLENISAMLDNFGSYTILPAVTPDGTYRKGEDYAEFVVDTSSLWDCVHAVFCS